MYAIVLLDKFACHKRAPFVHETIADELLLFRCGFKTVERSGRSGRKRRTCFGLPALWSRRRVCRRSAPSTTRRSSTSPPPPLEALRTHPSRQRPTHAGACTDTTTPQPHCPTIIRAPAADRPADHRRRCTRRSSDATYRCSAHRRALAWAPPQHIITRPVRWLPLPAWWRVTAADRRRCLRPAAVRHHHWCTRALRASTVPCSSNSWVRPARPVVAAAVSRPCRTSARQLEQVFCSRWRQSAPLVVLVGVLAPAWTTPGEAQVSLNWDAKRSNTPSRWGPSLWRPTPSTDEQTVGLLV